jgi:hypothetical protein
MGRRRSLGLPAWAVALVMAGMAADGFAESGASGELTVTWEVDGSEISTADQVRVSVRAEAPADYEIDLGDSDADFGEFSVVSKVRDEPRLTGGGKRKVETVRWVLEPFLPGEYEVPAMTVTARVLEREDNPLEVVTEAVPIRVNSLLPGETKELDIKDLTGAPGAGGQGWWIILVVALACGGLGGWLVLRGREGEGAEVPRPDEAALRDLEGIELRAEPDEVGDRLQTVFEGYVEAGGVDLNQVDDEAATVLARFRDGVDHLRFSDQEVPREEGPELADLFRRFVSLTKAPKREEVAL